MARLATSKPPRIDCHIKKGMNRTIPISDHDVGGNNKTLSSVASTVTGRPISHELVAPSTSTHHTSANRTARNKTVCTRSTVELSTLFVQCFICSSVVFINSILLKFSVFTIYSNRLAAPVISVKHLLTCSLVPVLYSGFYSGIYYPVFTSSCFVSVSAASISESCLLSATNAGSGVFTSAIIES